MDCIVVDPETNAGQIIELLGSRGAWMTTAVIAAELGLDKREAIRDLLVLTAHELVERTRSRDVRYRLSGSGAAVYQELFVTPKRESLLTVSFELVPHAEGSYALRRSTLNVGGGLESAELTVGTRQQCLDTFEPIRKAALAEDAPVVHDTPRSHGSRATSPDLRSTSPPPKSANRVSSATAAFPHP